jgi:hypothetical protein
MDDVPQIKPLAVAAYASNPSTDADPADQRAVEQLIHSYSYAWDDRDPDATAALFTDNAELSFFVNGAREPTHRTIGHHAILEGMTARAAMLSRWRIETRHLMLNTVFGPTESGAVQAMTTAVIYWQQLPSYPQPLAVQTGYYKSWCVQTGERWRFWRRETHLSGVFHPREIYDNSAPEAAT